MRYINLPIDELKVSSFSSFCSGASPLLAIFLLEITSCYTSTKNSFLLSQHGAFDKLDQGLPVAVFGGACKRVGNLAPPTFDFYPMVTNLLFTHW